MQILLNLAGFGPLLTSVAISANGMVWLAGGAGLGWLGVFGWQAGWGVAWTAWLAGMARRARRGGHGWQAIVPLGLSGRDSFRGEEYYEHIPIG